MNDDNGWRRLGEGSLVGASVNVSGYGDLNLLREVAARAEATLNEQRREFPRGEILDLDDLEDALNAWKRSVKAPSAQEEK